MLVLTTPTDPGVASWTSGGGLGVTLQDAYEAGPQIDVSAGFGALLFQSTSGTGALTIGNGTALPVTVNISSATWTSAADQYRFVATTGFALRDDSYVASAPNTTFDLNGSTAYRLGATVSITTSADANVNIDASGPVTFLPISGSVSNAGVTGFTGGADGRTLIVYNSGVNAIIFFDDVGSTGANRFYTSTRVATQSLLPGQTITLIYNATLTRWLIIEPYAGTHKYYTTTTLDNTTILQYTTFLLAADTSLPSLNASATGREIRIVNTDLANPITITPPGSGIPRVMGPGTTSFWVWNNPTWYGTGG
jgi:hypothetical protein